MNKRRNRGLKAAGPIILLACLISVASIVGCATTPPPRIDGSSEAAFNRSMGQLQRSLNASQREALILAMVRIQFMDVHSALELIGRPELARFESTDLRNEIDGMTFQDILEYADRSAVTVGIETP